MPTSWEDSSEIVAGLLIMGKLSVNAVSESLFFPPYDEIIKQIKSGKSEPEDLIETVGLNPVQASLEAAKSLNGLSGANWIRILENSALMYDAGTKMEKLGRKLQRGEEIDWSQMTSIAAKSQSNIGHAFTPLSEIEGGQIPFKPTGLVAIDEHLTGFPETGQVIVAAPPGTGKTTLLTAIASCWAKQHEQETVGIFTLEMIKKEIANRFSETSSLTEEQKSRILINDDPLIPEEVLNKSATIPHRGLILIDFADLLVRGETTESAVAHIYRTFMLGAKALNCPVVLLSQLNRNYTGGIPRPYNIRYSGLAEALGWMILMLYNPSTDYFAEEDTKDKDNKVILPIIENRAYIIAWKVRGGFRKHLEDSPGAIQIPFRGDKGWATKSKGQWFSLRKLS
ncbi:MAG: hypothetical protein A2W22_03085 [Candidatus Levybacteria bacterium RBG_16_35_11]|nr:MAG: hypothetical protein A2W22_03085 [Candidatus Levybacteria bacterium RBG_16_35_11]